ncbi:hypothetical protein [uncultured Ezakiella sp.]|uniref:hypothetical protein n=1 Tax=uncultured Ezakiella sp. TaxID=1637529 RepID=UPI0025CFE93F|nr:hypothetical protein [uncultured Ezakiella sp.]
MGLFGERKTKEEKIQDFVDRYELQDLDEKDVKTLYKLRKSNYLQAVIEQNFIIIRELKEINKNLEDLKNK